MRTYGLGPRIVLLAVFDRHHDVPPLGNGHSPRGGIGVKFAQVCTDETIFSVLRQEKKRF